MVQRILDTRRLNDLRTSCVVLIAHGPLLMLSNANVNLEFDYDKNRHFQTLSIAIDCELGRQTH